MDSINWIAPSRSPFPFGYDNDRPLGAVHPSGADEVGGKVEKDLKGLRFGDDFGVHDRDHPDADSLGIIKSFLAHQFSRLGNRRDQLLQADGHDEMTPPGTQDAVGIANSPCGRMSNEHAHIALRIHGVGALDEYPIRPEVPERIFHGEFRQDEFPLPDHNHGRLFLGLGHTEATVDDQAGKELLPFGALPQKLLGYVNVGRTMADHNFSVAQGFLHLGELYDGFGDEALGL